jgi:hypothetical protein
MNPLTRPHDDDGFTPPPVPTIIILKGIELERIALNHGRSVARNRFFAGVGYGSMPNGGL